MKQCSKCKQWKNESCFCKDSKGKNGVNARCRACCSIANKKYKNTRKEYKKTPGGKKASWRYHVKAKYGVNTFIYQNLLEQQNYVCAICKRPEVSTYKSKVRPLSVDHNHKTGKVRGLLCDRCNRTLGSALEDKEILLQAALYLEQHND
jgi:hypothetical protein